MSKTSFKELDPSPLRPLGHLFWATSGKSIVKQQTLIVFYNDFYFAFVVFSLKTNSSHNIIESISWPP